MVPATMHSRSLCLSVLMACGACAGNGASRSPAAPPGDLDHVVFSDGTTIDFPVMTALADGRVLATGGVDDAQRSAVARAEIWASGRWTALAPMPSPRSEHVATLLASGAVLITGGYEPAGPGLDTQTATVLRWDEVGGFTELAPMNVPRRRHSVTVLPNGRVLVVGGDNDSAPIETAEVYDPASNAWIPTGPLASGRMDHTATLLPDGRVAVVGGLDCCDSIGSIELWDPATGVFTSGGTLAIGRINHEVEVAADGALLVRGGSHVVETEGGPKDYEDLTDEERIVMPPRR